MGYLIGVVLAIGVAIMARAVKLDRDRAFYSTVLIIVGSYYVLFAAIAGSTSAMTAELAGFAVFLVLAIVGFKRSMWLVAAGLVAHGVFDLFHASVIADPGVPVWWPSFCAGYDVAAGAILAILLRKPSEASGTALHRATG